MKKPISYRLTADNFDYGQDDPPMFDWRDFLTDADAIVATLNRPLEHPPAKHSPDPSPGLDLSIYREDISTLLANAHERYQIELDDFELRNDPKRPPKSGPRKKDIQLIEISDDLLPLKAFDSNPDESWQLHWQECYARPRGNPGKSRQAKKPGAADPPPIKPLHAIYNMVRAWWRRRDLGQYTPSFAGGDVEAENNPDSRLLLAVIANIDARYDFQTARGLYETMRKSDRSKRRDTAPRRSKPSAS